ncbi:MAG: FumA C-terminus/TtdB family hydratase beta subunit [Candidatus Omnitrophota bacterium]
MKKIIAPLKDEIIAGLEAGEEVLLSGVIYTARDQAHLRMINLMEKGEALPVELAGQVIYYCGPTPPGPRAIGACGPTTSSRMDAFTPAVLEAGLKGIIGKGKRSDKVRESIKDHKAVYFLAPGGAGAYLSERVKACEVVAFEDLGAEAIHKLQVEDFPLIVGIDSSGRDMYKPGRE